MASTIRRSSRLREKSEANAGKVEVGVEHLGNSSSSGDSQADSDYNENKIATASGSSTRKRRGGRQLQGTGLRRTKRRKDSEEGEKVVVKLAGKGVEQKRRPPKKTLEPPNRSKEQNIVPECETNQNCDLRKPQINNNSSDSSSSKSSDDEWEEVDGMDFNDGLAGGAESQNSVEVTIKKPKTKMKSKESVGVRRARFIRQHVNQKIRERRIHCHKMHLLCYIAHLRIWARTLTRNEDLLSLCLSLMPVEQMAAAHHRFNIPTAEKFLHWFGLVFQPAKKEYIAKNGFCYAQVQRLEELIADKAYESDRDLAFVLFLCLIALKQRARVCLSCQPMPYKLPIRLPDSEHTEALIRFYGDRKLTANDYAEWPSKLEDTVRKIMVTMDDNVTGKSTVESSTNQKSKRTRRNHDGRNDETSTGDKKFCQADQKGNYWVEYWDEDTEGWICLEPWKGSVNRPESVEANVTPPMHYVLCIDNEYGMRDITARYASKYLMPEVRRLWADQKWWTETVNLYRSKNRNREQLEDAAIQKFLFSLPKPATVPEYKNHPLYALEKDLSKYETIYPENQQPIGQIKGFDIYPRSSVHRLDGSINWMKQFRSIKPGEKPYRVVNGRPNNRASPEFRLPKTVDLYGRWQTEPYVTPKIVNGRVPRNEFGNLYVYKSSMVPDGCVHMRLNGLLAVARRLDIDCVPAVIGWNHCRGGSHPILEGCVVLKEHEEMLREAWKKQYEKKKMAAEKRQKERAIKNWRRLVKGLLTMKRVRAKFLSLDRRSMHVDEKLENEEPDEMQNETPATDDMAFAWPPTAFNLPGTSSEC